MITVILYTLYGGFMFVCGYAVGWTVAGGDKNVPKK